MYERTHWVDHVVSPQFTYTIDDNGDGTHSVNPAGQVIQEGTPIDQAHLNHMEEGIEAAHKLIEALTETVNDGVSSVYTPNGNSFDDNGLTINPDGGEMDTKIDGSGFSVGKNESGQEIFSAKGSEVRAKNLSVTGTVTLDGKTRIEPYGDSRMGLFWIGG